MRHAALFGLLLAGCGGPVGDTDFTSVRDEILLPSCGFGSCHGGGEGYLTLNEEGAHGALVGVESVGKAGAVLVIPGDPDNSYLIQKLEGAAGISGDRMPPSGGIDAERIERVRGWIAAGALDD